MKKYKDSVSIVSLLKRLFKHVSRHRRSQFVWLFALTIASSFAEIISLGSVLPFVGILTQPEKVFNHKYIGEAVRYFGITSPSELILPISLVFSITALLAAGVRLSLLWYSIRLSNATGADLSVEIYRRTLYQPYQVHLSRNSSEIISGITQKVGTVTGVLISIATVFTSFFLFIAILGTLFIIDPLVATISILGFGSCYGVLVWKTRGKLATNSQCISQEQIQVVKALQEGLGAIRDVLLDGTQKIYCSIYKKAILKLQRANSSNAIINQGPRYGMESIGMVLIAILALILNYRDGGVANAFPVLAALALGAQRLLPLLQLIYGNWTLVAGSRSSLLDVLLLLEQKIPPEEGPERLIPLKFKNTIRFHDVSFSYGGKETPLVLDKINLTIKKGERVGIVGTTGSGKSTLLDLLMALIEPVDGEILVDDIPIKNTTKRIWQLGISHVPQFIYLADATIAENIAFGVPFDEIDMDRVYKVAEKAQISEMIESRPEKYQTLVGERGVRLSGGQRQRIGIARALYKQASVLIFDEATSSLDDRTEKDVMDSIEKLNRDLTIIMIAHRLTSVKQCDKIINLENGKIISLGSYASLMQDINKLSDAV